MKKQPQTTTTTEERANDQRPTHCDVRPEGRRWAVHFGHMRVSLHDTREMAEHVRDDLNQRLSRQRR